MIKMRYSEFMSFGFAQAFQKLAAHNFTTKVAYQIKKIGDEANRYRDSIRAEYQAVIKEYANKDEKGEIIQADPKDPNSFDVDEKRMEAYKAAEKAFGEKEVTLSRNPLTVADLGDLKLTAVELSALGNVVAFEDDQPVASVTPIKSSS